MPSRFRLQIVDTVTNRVVEWEPGLSVEIDFIEDVVSRTLARGVGIFRGSKHVADDLKAAIEESIFNLKKQVRAKV